MVDCSHNLCATITSLIHEDECHYWRQGLYLVGTDDCSFPIAVHTVTSSSVCASQQSGIRWEILGDHQLKLLKFEDIIKCCLSKGPYSDDAEGKPKALSITCNGGGQGGTREHFWTMTQAYITHYWYWKFYLIV